jgi:Mn-dependent DtxR family transcriptional regulator
MPRTTTLAEYRNRHSVYQLTEAGYRAHRAVMEERLLRQLLADLDIHAPRT